MYTVNVIASVNRGAAKIAASAWVPELPSFHRPYVEWAPGQQLAVDAVTFLDPWEPVERPTEGIAIAVRGVLLDSERDGLLARGWRYLP